MKKIRPTPISRCKRNMLGEWSVGIEMLESEHRCLVPLTVCVVLNASSWTVFGSYEQARRIDLPVSAPPCKSDPIFAANSRHQGAVPRPTRKARTDGCVCSRSAHLGHRTKCSSGINLVDHDVRKDCRVAHMAPSRHNPLVVMLTIPLVIGTRELRLPCERRSMDDALAISLALKSEEISVRAITAVTGNLTADRTAANALRILDMLDAPDIP